jgi:hypothetical protein
MKIGAIPSAEGLTERGLRYRTGRIARFVARTRKAARSVPCWSLVYCGDCGHQPEQRVRGRPVDDVIGLFTEFRPKFVRRYAEVAQTIEAAVREYAADVRARRFPAPEHAFGETRS